MAINIADGFKVNAGVPVDSRFVFVDLTARDALDSVLRYQGLKCFVIDEGKFYSLVGGTGNENWIEEGAGDVTGPGSSSNNVIAVFNGTTGKLLKQGTDVKWLLNGGLILNYFLAGGYAIMNSDGQVNNSVNMFVSIQGSVEVVTSVESNNFLTIISNDTGNEIVIVNEDVNSSVGNRILTGTGKDLKLKPGAAIGITYNSVLNRFQVVGGTGGGSAEPAIRSINTNETLTEDDDIVLVDTTTGDVEITLPTTYTKKLTIKKLVDDNSVTILGTIDGSTDLEIFNANNKVTLVQYNSEWYTV